MNDAQWKSTACILCECNCGLEVQLGGEDGRHLVRIRGDKQHPSSQGYACEKAQRLDYYQNGRDRLTTPLRRRADGSFETIDWDTAIREVAERLAAVRDKHGGDTIFYYGGGGQGNHLPGAYATATRAALGSRFRSSALAQEKTGEFWIADRMLGGGTRADFEHCDVALFLGKNPWHSHSIARARVTLKALAKDPDRTLIVIDPRRTETAALADIHLQVRPGCDAWLVAAMVAILFEEQLLDAAFLTEFATGLEAVREVFGGVQISAWCERAGVDEALVRRATRAIGQAKAFSSMEDLGVQMNRHSTLLSYLHRLLWLLTGNLGKPGTHYFPTTLVPFMSGASKRVSPVVGAKIVAGLVPCNVIAEEILCDHDKRYRAMIVEAANPAHSLADSKRMREAFAALDTLVVIDVAMTETARLADYVLPASTQYEKAEATFFNFEFPHNYFHLRPKLLDAPEGPLAEAEIHARLCEALGAIDEDMLAPLREAAAGGRAAYAQAMMARVLPNPQLARLAAVILYRTLGPTLPEPLREGAALYGIVVQAALKHGPSLARAGFGGTPLEAADALFDALLEQHSGVVFAVDRWEDQRPHTPDGKLHLALDDMLAELESLGQADRLSPETSEAFPFVLSAGERRSFTANTIIRNPEWRKKDGGGSLRISPVDATALGVGNGDRVRLTTKRDHLIVGVEVNDSMRCGHVSLPNGLGLSYPSGVETGDDSVTGAAPNELTAAEDRDRFVGTPWHKFVPARIERLVPDA